MPDRTEAAVSAPAAMLPLRSRNPVRRLYAWTESLAQRPHGAWSLFGVAFVESSFFPVPPDIVLIALAIARPRRSLWFAAVCAVGSVLGGLAGYAIGMFLFETVGRAILEFYGGLDGFARVQGLYHQYDAWVVFISGFTPIPYKVFTIGAGACGINLAVFAFASLLGRASRFFLVAGLLWKFGPAIKPFLEKNFNALTVIFTAALIGGFILLKFVL
jgi:membrane protein YqaA with SNARE-associated domain